MDADHSFDQLDALLLASLPEQRLDAIVENVPELPDQLATHELAATATRVAGLLTVPALHANSVRLEALAHLAVAYCVRGNVPRHRQLDQWLNQSLSSIAHLEDPVEDVFVTNVISAAGNHRLFEGLWESADFWTQQVLDALARIPNQPHRQRLLWHVVALLKLSEEVAKRSEIARFMMGGGKPKTAISTPTDEILAELSQRVSFDQKDLERLNIQRKSLEPFLLPNERSATRADEIGRSTLERRPLLAVGDRVFLLLPAAVSSAVRRFVLDECHRLGLTDSFAGRLQEQQTVLLFRDLLPRLKAKVAAEPQLTTAPCVGSSYTENVLHLTTVATFTLSSSATKWKVPAPRGSLRHTP